MLNSRMLFSALLLVLLAAPAGAQDSQGEPGQRQGQGQGQGQRVSPEQRMQRLSEALQLSAEQEEEVRQIFRDSRNNRPNMRTVDPEQARSVMCTHMLDTDRKISQVLDEEQNQRWAELKDERKSAMANGRGRRAIDCSEFEEAEA